MRKTFTLAVLCLCLFGTSALAQTTDNAAKFGQVSKNELELSRYDKDPEAEAVVLFDVGESYFYDTEKGYDIRFTRTKRIKIFDKAGLSYAEVSIPFYVDGYGRTERVASIEAYSYNLEGGQFRKKALTPNKVFEEQINDRWRAKKFVFPDVQEGSVIEYKYVLETPFHFNLPDWQFQDRIPTVYSQYTAKMIPFYEYVFLAQGISKFDFQDSKEGTEVRQWGSINKAYGVNYGNGFKFKDLIHTYVLKDVPAFRDESYITSPSDYVAKIDFQLAKVHNPVTGTNDIISTWPKLTEELLKHENFGKYLKGAERAAKKLLEGGIISAKDTDLEKSKKIVEYVKKNFSWNGYYDKYAPNNPREFLSKKSGNAAEINLFLTALLRAADLQAHPVILSTRNHGKIKSDYPFLHFFNYAIVLVDLGQQSFLADGTEELSAFNRLPLRCINDRGLVVKEKEPIWLDLYSNIQSIDSKNIILKPDVNSLTAKATVTIQSTEFDALLYRNLYQDDSAKIKEQLTSNGFTEISRIKTFNYDKLTAPYLVAYEAKTPLEKIDNKIVVSPFLDFPIQENKLTQKSRSYPVDFIYPQNEMLTSVLQVPEGYKVISMPEEYTFKNELVELNLNFSVRENIVEARANYHFKKGLYQPQEYEQVKRFIEIIVKKFNEQVVLEAL